MFSSTSTSASELRRELQLPEHSDSAVLKPAACCSRIGDTDIKQHYVKLVVRTVILIIQSRKNGSSAK